MNPQAEKKKGLYDKPYESATESGGGFRSRFGFRPFDSNKEGNSFKDYSIKKLDGYNSGKIFISNKFKMIF